MLFKIFLLALIARSTVTSTPAAPLLNLTVTDANGTVCILMQMRARFLIGYYTKNGFKTEDVPLPTPTRVNGTCRVWPRQVLTVHFNNGWRAQFEFAGDSWVYVLASIQLDYKETFVGSAEKNHTARSEFFANFLTVWSGGYFSCNAKQKYEISTTPQYVVMETQELKVQAFRKSNSTTGFTGERTQCSEDVPPPERNFVPFILWAILAALVITVLVVYTICSRRTGGAY